MDSQSIALTDGRRLAFQRYGDAGAMPVFYFHGWPGSRWDIRLLPGLPVQVIALDRPGYGGSSPQPGRRLLDWPSDVAAVADHLGIGRFGVVGASGGGPYALACAYGLAHRVTAATLICPVPPSVQPARVPASPVRLLFQLGHRPQLAAPILGLARRVLRATALINPATLAWLMGWHLPASDRRALTGSVLNTILESFREGIRPGIAGLLSDAAIYSRPWGFDLTQVQLPVSVWHGTADTLVPVATAACYAALPDASIHVMEGEGHYSVVLSHGRHIVAVLQKALQQREACLQPGYEARVLTDLPRGG